MILGDVSQTLLTQVLPTPRLLASYSLIMQPLACPPQVSGGAERERQPSERPKWLGCRLPQTPDPEPVQQQSGGLAAGGKLEGRDRN